MNHSHNRVIVALIAMVTACSGLLLTAAPAQAVDSEPFVVIQANLGSGVDSDLNKDGVYAGHASNEDPILAVSDKARVYRAHVITMQEVCSEDVERMRVHLQNITSVPWYNSQFAQMSGPSKRHPNSCQQAGRTGKSTNAKGNVMLTRVPIYANEDTLSLLGEHSGRTFTLGCMNVAFAGSRDNGARTAVCNTHLPAGSSGTAATKRLRYAKQIKNGIPRRTHPNGVAYSSSGGVDAIQRLVPTVLAGDFNIGLRTNVSSLFHRINSAGTGLNGAGKFWEADHETGSCSYDYCRKGSATLDSGCCKYDYVYFGTKYGKGPASVDLDVHGNPTGNHKIIVSQSRFTW